MSAEADLARDIAKVLLRYANYKDAAEDQSAPEDGELLPLPESATSQRQVVALLATASHKGLTAREIADQTEVTQFNVYEKLDRLGELGYAEEVPDSNPKRWHLSPRARRLAHDGTRLRIAPSVSGASADEIKDAISWCVETTGEHATFTAAMESRRNVLASWAKEDYPGLKTWNGPQPPSKPEIATYLRHVLVALHSGNEGP
jgi:DNA-binding MarR family transcriptional regulator